MPRFLLQLCIATVFLCGFPLALHAAQWQVLNNTSRYKVAYDEQSVRLIPSGQVEIVLRFIPRGKAERKSAALVYKEKRYHSHREHYQINCSGQTAQLTAIDILSALNTRLKSLRGNTEQEAILPGSTLDNAAQRICPVLDVDNDESDEPELPEEPDTPEDAHLSSDQLQQIEMLKKETTSNIVSAESWRNLGNVYFDTNQPELAIKAYDKALALLPDDIDILNDQGTMYRQIGDYTHALANFEKALSISPQNLDSLYNSGYVLAFDLNNIPKALVMWRRYLELEVESDVALQVQTFIDQYGK